MSGCCQTWNLRSQLPHMCIFESTLRASGRPRADGRAPSSSSAVVVPFEEATHDHQIAGIARDAGLLHVQADKAWHQHSPQRAASVAAPMAKAAFLLPPGRGRKVGGAGLALLSISSSIE